LPGGRKPEGKKLVWPGFAFIYPDIRPVSGGIAMEFTPINPIQPLWESPIAQDAQKVENDPENSLFANIFRQAVQDVRDTNAEQVNLEYQLATGQIDNPALVNTATAKAATAAELLMQLRNKALDVYNELMRISI